jgi:hypothetical protein
MGARTMIAVLALSAERGVIYLNSRAQSFVEEGSPLAEEYGAEQGTWARASSGWRQLRPLGQW